MFWDILNTVYVIGVVLLLFNLTIFIHELGHYWVGRWRGAKIDRFAIWFGPAIWSRTIHGVEFRLGCIPLGGYVAFPQLAMEEIEGKSEIPAEQLPPLKPRDKIPILLAGSFSNVLLGVVVACVVWIVGLPQDPSDFDMTVGYVPPQSPEAKAGIQPGDKIVSINGTPVKDWDEIRHRVALSLTERVKIALDRQGNPMETEVLPDRDHLFKIRMLALEHANAPIAGLIHQNSPAEKAGIRPGDEFLSLDGEKILGRMHLISMVGKRADQPTRITVKRNGETIALEVTPKIEKKSGQALMGVQLDFKHGTETVTVHPSPWSQIAKSLLLMADTLNALLHSRTSGIGVGDLSGPLGIGTVLYQSIQLDFRLALSFLVVLNINLAIVNLLPIPVLDGGHIVFSLIEAIRRKPLNQKVMDATQTVFVALLLTFMVYVTFNDITRLSRMSKLGGKASAATESRVPVFEEKAAP